MRIGWIKYGQYLHLVPLGDWSGAGGTKMRVRLWRSLLKNGFQIDVFTEIGADHLAAFKELQNEFGDNNLRYRVGHLPVKLDTLVVECGPQSVLYGVDLRGGRRTNIPHIVRAHEVIRDYRGLVLYFQHDLELGFCFTLESLGPDFYFHGYERYARSDDLVRDKTWVVLTQPYLPDEFIKLYSDTRSPYEKLKIPAETFTTATLAIGKPIPPRKHPKWDLVFAGNWRKYMNYPSPADFRDYINGMENQHLRIGVYGTWPENVQKVMRRVEFRGAAAPGQQAQFMNRGACGILIGSRKICATGTLSGRYYEHLSGGAVVLIEDRFQALMNRRGSYYPFIPGELLVSRDTAHRKVKEICALPYSRRYALWESQWTGTAHLRDTHQFAERLEKIISKYKGRDLGQEAAHTKYTREYMSYLSNGNPQDRIKAACLKRGWIGVLYYPRVCKNCGLEVVLKKGQLSLPTIKCIQCGGRYERLQRLPRPIRLRFPRLEVRRFPRLR